MAMTSLAAFALVGATASVAVADDPYRSTTIEQRPAYRVDATAAATVVDTATAREGTTDTAQLLRQEPDLRLRRTGGLNGPAFVSIRGSEPDAVRFALDGTPLHGAATTVIDVNSLLPELLDSLHVYRTTTPVTLGPPAPGGVIDLRLRAPRRETTHASLAAGSWGTRRATVSWSRPVPGGALTVAATYRGAEGGYRFYNTNGTDSTRDDDDPSARRRNNDSNHGALLVVRDQRIDRTQLRFVSLTDVRDAGAAGLDVAQSQTARTSAIAQLLLLEGRHNPPGRTTVTWTASLHASRSRFDDLNGEIGVGRQQRSDQHTLAFLAARTSTTLDHGFSLHAGLDYQLEAYRPEDRFTPVLVTHASRGRPSAGGEVRWKSTNERFHASAAVHGTVYLQRNDSLDVPAAPDARVNQLRASPQAGITLRAVDADDTRVEAFGYASRTHRQPGFAELYGDNGGTVGNPALLAEQQSALETGLHLSRRAGDHTVHARLALWRHWRQNAIEYVALPTGVRKPFNLPGADVAGQELAVSWQHARAGATVAAARTTSANTSPDPAVDGRALPWRSPWSATASARVSPAQPIALELLWRFDAPFYADLRNRRQYPDRNELDVALTVIAPSQTGLRLRVDIFNLLDRRTAELPARDGGRDTTMIRPIADFQGYPRPGRGIHVTASWTQPRQ